MVKKSILSIIMLTIILGCEPSEEIKKRDSLDLGSDLETVEDQAKDLKSEQSTDISMDLIDDMSTGNIDMGSECTPSLGTTLPMTNSDPIIVMVRLLEVKDGQEIIIGNGGARTTLNSDFTVAYQKNISDIILTFDSSLSVKLSQEGVVTLQGKIARKENQDNVIYNDIDECVKTFGRISSLDFTLKNNHLMRVVFSIEKSN